MDWSKYRDVEALHDSVRQLDERIATSGGRIWLHDVLVPNALAETIVDRPIWSGRALNRPWDLVALWVDRMVPAPDQARGLTPERACAAFLDATYGDLARLRAGLTREHVLETLDFMEWKLDDARAVLSLGDGEAAWGKRSEAVHTGYFCLGEYPFHIGFHRLQRDRELWEMGWANLREVPPGAGLFPRAASHVKRFVQDFLVEMEPEALWILGAGNRRTFYQKACPSWAPDGYTCSVLDLKLASGVTFDRQEPKPSLRSI